MLFESQEPPIMPWPRGTVTSAENVARRKPGAGADEDASVPPPSTVTKQMASANKQCFWSRKLCLNESTVHVGPGSTAMASCCPALTALAALAGPELPSGSHKAYQSTAEHQPG